MRKSFTLIELIVVIGIIALLSGLGVSTYNGFQQAARDSRRKADLETITNALNAYYAANGRFPQAGTCAYGAAGGCWVFSFPESDNWIPALVPNYIESLPTDPTNNTAGPTTGPADITPNHPTYNNYIYAYGNVTADGQGYDLTARLENTNDSDRCGVKNYKYYFDNRAFCNGEPTATGYPFGGSRSNQLYEFSPGSQ